MLIQRTADLAGVQGTEIVGMAVVAEVVAERSVEVAVAVD